MGALRRAFGRHADIGLVLLVVGVLVVLFAPIPPGMLDFLILCNFSFALLILLLTFYMAKPVEFSTFPSLLLIATLFRLSLNIAATRLILRDGDAGHVIGAVGAYVVGGNYVIGLIVFLILIVVQYVVVTSGAQRVSEVAARFTLDSMPGQQMSIDADLNMGIIDPAEAQRRRKNISKEAGFYGAMDGASKFVKGDAIAGILIMLINVVGGLVIGVMQMGMPWGQALQQFTLLTIGDGIVTQVPALIISVGTGLIVTRSASDGNLSNEVMAQLGAFPKTIGLVAAALCGVLLLPGLPLGPTLVLIVFWITVGFAVVRMRKAQTQSAEAGKEEDEPAGDKGDDAYAALVVHPVELNIGVQLQPLAGDGESLFMERVASFRRQFALESGQVLPPVRVRDHGRLAGNAYEINISGVNAGRGTLMPDHWLAIHPSGNVRGLQGVPAKEPTYGLPALWIKDQQRAQAREAKCTVIDAPTVLVTHLCEVLRQRSAELLSRRETEQMLERVRQQQPGLVEEVVPTLLAVGEVQKVLQNLLREKVSIRNLEAIMETIADHARQVKEAAALTELVRQRLGAAICQSLLSANNCLQVLTLDPELEQRLLGSLHGAGHAALALEPSVAERVVVAIARWAEKMAKANISPVVLCAPELRSHLRILSERMVPHLRVLSMLEVPNTLELRAFGSVSIE